MNHTCDQIFPASRGFDRGQERHMKVIILRRCVMSLTVLLMCIGVAQGYKVGPAVSLEKLTQFVEFLLTCPQGKPECLKAFAYYLEHGERDEKYLARCLAGREQG